MGRENAVINSLISKINAVLMKRVEQGDLVEVMSGNLKGQKSRVKQVNDVDNEVVVEGSESPIPIDKVKVFEKAKIPIKSLIQTEELRGYIFIESDELEYIEQAVKGVPHIRGVIRDEVTIEQIERFLVPEKQVIKVGQGDIVEVISGPFKGEKAKVTRIDEAKNEITVELLEAAIPIPVTISTNTVRIFEKGKKEE